MKLCEIALTAGGLVLEIAAGPDGGNLSPLLHMSPSLPIIVNDIEPRVLELWHDYLAEVLPQNKVWFAAFDAAFMPLRDNAVACASSCGGLGSIAGNRDSAICETFRVVRPGGYLIALEMAFTEETLRSLPEPHCGKEACMKRARPLRQHKATRNAVHILGGSGSRS